jgi:LacI family transcriptional regulator
LSGRDGRTVRIKDIAARAEVSVSTVSAILNDTSSNIRISEPTRRRVLRIAEELNYRPNLFARSLRTRKSYLVNVIVWDITDPYFGEILKGIEGVLKGQGYQLLLSSADADPENSCYSRVKKLPVDGTIIIGGPQGGIVRVTEEETAASLVFIGVEGGAERSCSITVDNYAGGVIGTEYLLQLGKDTLYYVTKARRTEDEEERLRGFLDTVEARDIRESSCEVLETESDPGGGYSSGVSIARQAGGTAAVFADNDLLAIGVLRALQDRGMRVPQQAAVLGFDNLAVSAYMQPRLSTLNQPRLEMGARGAQCLLDMITGEGEFPVSGRLRPELVKRESC